VMVNGSKNKRSFYPIQGIGIKMGLTLIKVFPFSSFYKTKHAPILLKLFPLLPFINQTCCSLLPSYLASLSTHLHTAWLMP
jgi:hypothetical protein